MSRGTDCFTAGLLSLPMVLWAAPSLATFERFTCALTDTIAKPGSENRPIIVIFDNATNVLEAEEGGKTHTLHNVSVSSVSISGSADDVSLGIDRSSRGIVFQDYRAAGKAVAIEFGRCQPAASTAERP
jgi:hypothetical protein